MELAVKEYDGWSILHGAAYNAAHFGAYVRDRADGGYCAENEIRSIMMGSDSNFDVNTTTFHVEPEGECLGEDENIMYICSPDGSMMYLWEFSESGCLGSYEVKQNASSPVDFGNGTYAACHCSPQTGSYLVSTAYADSNCTVSCDEHPSHCEQFVDIVDISDFNAVLVSVCSEWTYVDSS